MSRLIDADALKEWIDEYVSVFKKSDTREIKGYIEHQPTIDAVEVVRCKECKHSEPSEDNSLYCKHWDDHFGFFWDEVKSDDYCSYGERKETDYE